MMMMMMMIMIMMMMTSECRCGHRKNSSGVGRQELPDVDAGSQQCRSHSKDGDREAEQEEVQE